MSVPGSGTDYQKGIRNCLASESETTGNSGEFVLNTAVSPMEIIVF